MAALYSNPAVANAATVQSGHLNCQGALGASFLIRLGVAMTISFQASDDGTTWYTLNSAFGDNGPGLASTALAVGDHAIVLSTNGLPLVRVQANNASGGPGNLVISGFRDNGGSRN